MTADYVDQVVSRYKPRGILIDANVLLLYFIGKYDSEVIGRFKRTRTFTTEDYSALLFLIDGFAKLLTTPNVLTEVSNLSNQLSEETRRLFFSEFATQVALLDERYVPSSGACRLPHFNQLGLTDSAIVDAVRDKYLVLTDDLRFASYLENVGIDVINFNHVRTLYWES